MSSSVVVTTGAATLRNTASPVVAMLVGLVACPRRNTGHVRTTIVGRVKTSRSLVAVAAILLPERLFHFSDTA